MLSSTWTQVPVYLCSIEECTAYNEVISNMCLNRNKTVPQIHKSTMYYGVYNKCSEPL